MVKLGNVALNINVLIHVTGLFLYLVKTPENNRFFNVSRGYKNDHEMGDSLRKVKKPTINL